jgi:ribonuclease P protein subunit POP4
MTGSERYATLPKEIRSESETLGLQPLAQTPEEVVDEYVSLHVSQQEKKDKKERIRLQLSRKALILDNVEVKRAGKAREKKLKKRVGNALGSKEKRKMKLYEIPEEAREYRLYIPLHELWLKYMDELLQLSDNMDCLQVGFMQSKMLKADLHGSEVTGRIAALLTFTDMYNMHCVYSATNSSNLVVIRSKCPSYVGQSGIILMESQNTFKIICKDNCLKGL